MRRDMTHIVGPVGWSSTAAGDRSEVAVGELCPQHLLSNLPTEVFGTSSMNRTSSGSHHLATFPVRNSMTSSWVILPLNSGLATAKATGRSLQHFGCGMPITAASP